MKKKYFTLAAAGTIVAAALSMSALAAGPTVTSANGIITVTLPSDDWTEISDSTTCALFTDGKDMLAFNHYELGKESMPTTELTNGIVKMFHTVTVDQKYCYVVSGYCTDEDKEEFQEIKDAVNSVIINEDKMHSESHKLDVNTIAIQDMNVTMYCTADEMNVRPGGSTNGAPIAMLSYGDPVTVVGNVTENGQDTGWVKIDLNGVTGYVMAQYLSETQPADAEAKAEEKSETYGGATKTGSSKTLTMGYYVGRIIYEYTDGTWRDDYGNIFTQTEDGSWTCGDGDLYADEDPTTTLFQPDGTRRVVYKDRFTGQKYDKDGNTYADLGVGNGIGCSDGTIWYTGVDVAYYDQYGWEEPDEDVLPGPTDILIKNDRGEGVYVHSGGDGYYYSGDGRQFWCNEAGIFLDTADDSQWWQ